MSTATPPRLMTTEELLKLPDNGTLRELYDGELKETPVSRRGRRHSRTMATICAVLRRWLEAQPLPRGEVLAGDAGFRLKRNPDTTVGVDVAYLSPRMVASIPSDAYLVEGAPVLAVEVLSPSDQHDEVSAKVRHYLSAGVELVWIVDPEFQTVTVHQPRAKPQMFNDTQELSGDPHLPGFRVAVAELFS